VSFVVGFGGGRSVSPGHLRRVAALAACLARAGAIVRVGCASGVDGAVVRAVVAVAPSRLLVFCAFSASSPSAGAVRARWAAARGARVAWCAGGPAPSVAAALARRSLALSRSGLSAFVAVPGPLSRGTWLAVRAARSAGVAVSVCRASAPSAGDSGSLRQGAASPSIPTANQSRPAANSPRIEIRPDPKRVPISRRHDAARANKNLPSGETFPARSAPNPSVLVGGTALRGYGHHGVGTQRPRAWPRWCRVVAPVALAVFLLSVVLLEFLHPGAVSNFELLPESGAAWCGPSPTEACGTGWDGERVCWPVEPSTPNAACR